MKEINAALVLAGVIGAIWFYNRMTANPLDTTSSAYIDIAARLTGAGMKTSQQGRNEIEFREGRITTIYSDGAGYLTGGIGHKLVPVDGSYRLGDPIDAAMIDKWFNADISHAENIVNFYVNVPLSQNQFDALVSATFNLGSALFKNSNGSGTHLLAYLNNGDYISAASALLQFNHSGGIVVAGLTNRRMAEQQQFMA